MANKKEDMDTKEEKAVEEKVDINPKNKDKKEESVSDFNKRLDAFEKECAKPRDSKNPNFIAHGSSKHAVRIGIYPERATKENGYRYWKLQDSNQWGPAATQRFIDQQLDSLISSLSKPPMPQSEDYFAPHYAPERFNPTKLDEIQRIESETRGWR